MIAIRKLSPSGHRYLTGSVACGDRELDPGESLSDYYTAHGYPPGQWFGRGAAELGVHGEVTAAQMDALFGEGRHPDADRIEAEHIAAGESPKAALAATKLGRRFPQHSDIDDLRSKVIDAYKAHNLEHNRPIGAPIDDTTRAQIRRGVRVQAYADTHEGAEPSEPELNKWLASQKQQLKNATSGFELIIAPPKSVSVAWALGDEATRELIVGLHRQAVADTLRYFEDNVAHTRKGAGGIAQYDVRGITAACFEHWDSRSGDPHLHTHVPISSKVQGPDGKWTSLDGRTVYAAAVTTSEYYNSRLRDLFRQHGASWSERPSDGIDLKRPVWELDGVPTELLAGFSQRAAVVEQERAKGIVEFRDTHGREPSPTDVIEIGRRAQYGTRQAKQPPQTLAQHVQRWRGQAREMVDPSLLSQLGQQVFHSTPETVSEPDIVELAARTLATVSDHHAHFNVWNLEAEAHRQSAHLRVPDNTRDQLVDQIVQMALDDADTVSLQAPPVVEEPSELRRANGESVFVEHNAPRYTTQRTLHEEAALASWGRRHDGTRITTTTVKQALRDASLNAGQRQAVRAFATSGHRVQLLNAPAGAGKTTTMRAFADIWRAEAGTVHAFGPSARAAQELGNSIDARPHTLHQVTTALQHGFAERAFPFTRGDVLVIDEAAMAGTHTLHDVVRYALHQGADIRLVGDDRQLTAVEAGGALRWFAHHNDVLRLNEVVRFNDPKQAEASLKLHAADPEGLDYYFDHGWVQEGSLETIHDAAHHAWRNDLDAGVPSLLIVPSNDDVTTLNHQARQLRLQRGDVDPGRSVQLHDGTRASAGDRVVTRHNDRLTTLLKGTDFVKNGDTWTVLNVGRHGGLKLRHQDSRGTVTLPADYVNVHVELAYATTGNRAQGMSVPGNAHNLVTTGLSREQFYTQITRAAYENHTYVETTRHTIDSHQETPLEATGRGVLKATLERSSAETSANEEQLTSAEKARSLRTLVGYHDFLAHRGVDERIESVLTEHASHLLDLPAVPALIQTVRTAEDIGWQAENLIPSTLDQGALDDANDPAAVLQWRIAQRALHDTPPPRLATPTQNQINHWRSIAKHHQGPDVTEPAWNQVWKLTAAGDEEGLDADAAITTATRALLDRPTADPMHAHDHAAGAVAVALAEQRAHGNGWNPALPWMARPDHRLLSNGERDYLQRLDTAIGARRDQLRAQVAADPPAWTAALGPRPQDTAAAEHWDQLAGLAAAYRDTYAVTTDDPTRPLGPRPDSHGLRGRAFAELINQWAPPTTETARVTKAQSDTLDRLREQYGVDELLEHISETAHDPTMESLATLVAQHSEASRLLVDQASRQALAEHAPDALGQPSEAALLATVRRAEALGWQPGRVIARAATSTGREHTTDAAAVLRWRIESHIADHTPPAPVAEPTSQRRDRWHSIVTQALPGMEITEDWNLVWRHAAGGDAEGLDTDTAIVHVAQQIANRPTNEPMATHRYAAQSLVNHLTHQRDNRTTDAPALPWMTNPHRTLHTTNPALGEQLDELTTAIHTRTIQLHDHTTTKPPLWATALGPRPHNPSTAETWGRLITLAAAYRETYGINTTDPNVPLGPNPTGPTTKSVAWQELTQNWRNTMPTPETNGVRDNTIERIHALQNHIQETHDEHNDQRTAHRHDEIARRTNSDIYNDERELENGPGSHMGL